MEDPFIALQHTLRSAVYLSHGSFFDIQLYCLFALQGVSLLLILASLIIRWRCEVLWISRIHKTSAGSWITLNPVVCWLSWSALFLGALLKFTSMTLMYGEVGSDLHNIMLWRCLTWLPLFLAGWSMCWSTYLSPLLSKQISTRQVSLSHFPAIANFLFFLVPFLLLGSIIPLSIYTNDAFNKLFSLFCILDEALTMASLAHQEGQVIANPETLSNGGAAFPKLLSQVTKWWKRVWLVWVGFGGLLFIFFTLAACCQYYSLRSEIQALKRSVLLHTASAYSRKLSDLVWAYRALLFTTVVTVLIIGCYVSLGVVLAVEVRDIVTGSTLGLAMNLAGIYIYAVLGTITNLVIFLRSFSTSSHQQLNSQGASVGSKSFGNAAPGIRGPHSVAASVMVTQDVFSETTTFEMVFVPGSHWLDDDKDEKY